jgi:hypothetical protein
MPTPNVPLAAFTEYAADTHWVASHLMQLSGMGLMVITLVLISRSNRGGGQFSHHSGITGCEWDCLEINGECLG